MTLPNELHPGFLASAGGGDVGDTIPQSLRFVDTSSPRLTRTFSQNHSSNSSTVSYWLKRGKLGTLQTVGCMDNGQNELFGRFNTSDQYVVVASSGGHTTTRVFRDPSAWYHIFINQTTLYINGVLEHTGTLINGITSKDKWNIGQYGANLIQYFDGYIADFHFVDGTNKAHTDFGKLNEDGVWVPQNYTGSYGTNGFHLTFDSSQTNGIGHDSSGNNNHFTATGFDTGSIALYSPDAVSSTGSFYAAGYDNKAMFDGSTATFAQTNTEGGTITWTPWQTISYSSSVVVSSQRNAADQCVFNGSTTVSMAAGGVVGETTIATGSGTISSMAFSGYYGGSVHYIKVDGTILVDNTDNDVDYFDTPTSNYALWNSLSAVSADVSFSDANLRLGTTASQAWTPGYLTFGPFECGKPGKYYFEMNDDGATGYKTCNFGVTDNLSIAWSNWWWNIGDTLSWYPETGAAYRNGGSSFSFGTNSTSGGKAMAIDFEAGTINAYSGGTLVGSLTGSSSNLTVGKEYYIVAATSNSNSTTMPFNFGQMPFIYTVPTGYKALQTNNLPDPTIKNGKDHFEAITWTGDGNDNRDITTTESFQPDFVWIKRRSTLDHGLFDSVRGGNKILYSNLTIAEDTSSVNIKQFNSDGFRLGTGAQVNASSETYVAWCWKAGGTAVSNGNGSITSSVSANTDAGFSIVSYTGNETSGATVGHGLNEAPEWILFKNRTSSSFNWLVYHKYNESSAGAGDGHQRSLILNTDAAGGSESSMLNNTAPGNSVITLGSAQGSNGSTTMIAYCWHSVENFSKFGSYTGNASGSSPNADGPFVYLGFRPAFLMIKRSDSNFGGEWSMHDTTRSPNNPNRLVIAADLPNAEITQGGIDFLSNGFKIRDGAGWTNQSGGNYVYMAFAESPFGGENVPPATAR